MKYLHNMNKLILQIIILTIITQSCVAAEMKYGDLQKELRIAVENRDKELLIDLSNKIGEKEIKQSDGLLFLKLKITALTFAAEYGQAFDFLSNNLIFYTDNYELFLGKGIISEILNLDWRDDFNKAYRILNNISMKSKNEQDRITEYYLALLIGECQSDYVKNELLPTYSENEKMIISEYEKMSLQELLQNPPIGFVALEPIIDDVPSEKKRWWE